MADVDWGKFEDELGGTVAGLVTSYMDGGVDDLADFVNRITMNMSAALQEGRGAELGDEIKAQWRALAEEKRITAAAANWAFMEKALEVALKVGLAALGAVAL